MNLETYNTEFLSYRIPGIVSTGKGSLLAYYECRKDMSDWAEIVIKIIKSTDSGENWKEIKRIVSQGDTLNNPVITVNGDTLHMLYCVNYRRVFYIKSEDDGETWSEPEEITPVFDSVERPFTVIATGPGHGIVTPRGVMVIPVWYAYNRDDEKAHKPSFIGTVYSSDNGATWQAGELLNADFLVNPSECALTVLSDGSVMMSVRNESERRLRAHAYSKNGFKDWYGIDWDERFPDPVCQGSLCYGGEKNYFINCNSQIKRANLTVKVSEDDFKTFKEIPVSEKGGYADIAEKDGTLFVLREYANNGELKFSIDFEKISLQ